MNQTNADHRRGFRLLILSVFVVSGFAGLIYESIWSHYLKLFLGHAAYAQTLVLALYMGGMAGGAWLAGRWSARLRQPLLVYAGVELALGFAALAFHAVFVASTDWAFDSVIPALDSPWVIDAFKWTLGALLILPQCILLGATFPLVSAGVIRTYPEGAGASLSGLYFTNSLGAAAGVLVSGFVLIALVGLPGTMMTAGLLNVAIALTVWAALKVTGEGGGHPLAESSRTESGRSGFGRLMLLVAFITGATSFMYEVGWIRMLSLVLGSATHSFELMLSAFILGLALGALLIRSHIDRFDNPAAILGLVQIVMGALAVFSLPIYNSSFHWMSAALGGLASTHNGYVLFNLISHLICIAMMVPVTIFAGMTLPLITHLLIKRGEGESAIGRVYASNTVGAIAGVLLAVHWLMPGVGLKWLVGVGALGDLALGVALLAFAGAAMRRSFLAVASVGVVTAVGVLLAVQLDPAQLSSGVFRTGRLRQTNEIVFHRDGKTSTVTVSHEATHHRYTIANNGKPDAAITLKPPPSGDDSTMILIAAIPLQYRPEAADIAVIGMGSGRSTHTFLTSPSVKRVDTIEIEPAVIEGARLFGPVSRLAYEDPRSHIHIEDAKTFFARGQQRYDIIMSEPPNPWVSGVASLFTQEFYGRVKHKLTADGLFAQWIQLYEIEPVIVASIMQALASEFPHYRLFAANDYDMLILASQGPLGPHPQQLQHGPQLAELMHLVGIENAADLALRHIADSEVIHPYFASAGVPANSDYFPYVDLHAVSARFRRAESSFLVTDLHTPLWGLAGQVNAPEQWTGKSTPYYAPADWSHETALIADFIRGGSGALVESGTFGETTRRMLAGLMTGVRLCDPAVAPALLNKAMSEYTHFHLPYAEREQLDPLMRLLRAGDCAATAGLRAAWAALLDAAAAGDAVGQLGSLEALLLKHVPQTATWERAALMNAAGAAALAGGQPQRALRLAQEARISDTPFQTSRVLRSLLGSAAAAQKRTPPEGGVQ